MTKDKKVIRTERQKIMQELATLEIRRDRGEKIAESDFEALGNKLSALNAGRPEKEDRTYDSKDPKVTKEIVAIAEKNGITRRAVLHRVYQMKMDPMEAATKTNLKRTTGEAAKKSGLTVEKFLYRKNLDISDVEIAKEFKISNRTLNTFKKNYAIRHKDIEAMRQPFVVKPEQPHLFDSYGKRIIPPEVFDLAEQNNIPAKTVYTRICTAKWDYYKAATKPLNEAQSHNAKRKWVN